MPHFFAQYVYIGFPCAAVLFILIKISKYSLGSCNDNTNSTRQALLMAKASLDENATANGGGLGRN